MQQPAIQVERLHKQFDEVNAVDGISFQVDRGSICGLLGGNGAGKTTTLSILLGLLTPSSGTITVLDEDMLTHRYRVLPRMNFSSPYVDLPMRLTVRENLTVYAHLYGVPQVKRRIAQLCEQLDIGEFIGRRYGTLSAGQRTRVALAKALLNQPELLLLDEPTASLDPDSADRIRTMLTEYQQQTGATLLLASHNMQEVERICDEVIMLRRGKVIDQGTPSELQERFGRDSMEQVFLDVARAGEGTA
ncbi:ABC transporter [Solemya pervernicosa gill symbiont]|uniref:ABC transporter n=1 Tax=Solemya pervernicosa gill symbiont TaxID=642797 RepID=A0A1T2L227_9GAMM|nr:ABC transporter ATP-binding protein [Solemya pervernicosa gill symbiont]OOZ39155.1 ABC transporter [Solemya pervernicosa gill symbiont]